MNENKATGPDDIPGKLLKICAFELHKVFTILFQSSLNLGAIPDDWKSAHIFPLFNKGDKYSAGNYRPISLTSISCKLPRAYCAQQYHGLLGPTQLSLSIPARFPPEEIL